MSSPKASLFVSTYEMPRHLELVFAGLARQTTGDFEILVCDDGSAKETRDLIETFAARSPIPVRHFWQEHQGFRKCRILNQAAREARGEIFVFLDGDCVPHRYYIEDHLNQQEEGYYLAGRRVELGPWLSAQITPQEVSAGFFDRPNWRLLNSVLKKDSEYFQRSMRVPFQGLRKLLKMDRVVDMKGCNYSIPRSALEAINGFDEEYEGYGREDTDVELRLQNLGLKIKSMKGLALQFHVWHPRREFTPSNDVRLEDLKKSGRVQALRGLRS
jgi:glycosyltransferase involved in cell wall biosynthesis